MMYYCLRGMITLLFKKGETSPALNDIESIRGDKNNDAGNDISLAQKI